MSQRIEAPTGQTSDFISTPLKETNYELSDSFDIPKTPTSLIILALLFVPFVYILLVFSGAMIVGVAYGIILIVKNIFLLQSIWLTVILLIGAGIGLIAVIKGIISTIWREPDFQPVIKIEVDSEPEFKRFLNELCNKMNTKEPRIILMHAEPDFFVAQAKIRGDSGIFRGRILSIGLPLLSGLSVNELRGILAHEFAHFTGRDTAYSSIVLPVYLGTVTTCNGIGKAFASKKSSLVRNIPLLLPYWILRLYLHIFAIIDAKISRSREQRADVIATQTCGYQSFSEGLKKCVGLGGAFYETTEKYKQSLGSLINAKDMPRSATLYQNFRSSLPHLSDSITKYQMRKMKTKEKIFDTHPNFDKRLRYTPFVPEQYKDEQSALSLFRYLPNYERALSEDYSEILAVNKKVEEIIDSLSQEF